MNLTKETLLSAGAQVIKGPNGEEWMIVPKDIFNNLKNVAASNRVEQAIEKTREEGFESFLKGEF